MCCMMFVRVRCSVPFTLRVAALVRRTKKRFISTSDTTDAPVSSSVAGTIHRPIAHHRTTSGGRRLLQLRSPRHPEVQKSSRANDSRRITWHMDLPGRLFCSLVPLAFFSMCSGERDVSTSTGARFLSTMLSASLTQL